MTTTRPDLLDNLLGLVPTPSGDTYDHDRDGARLASLGARVRECMADGAWRTLREIANHTGAPEASVSARLRDLRKPSFGGHTVRRKYLAHGLWVYSLEVKP